VPFLKHSVHMVDLSSELYPRSW